MSEPIYRRVEAVEDDEMLVRRLEEGAADWLAIGNAYLLRTTNQSPSGMMVITDPATLGFTGFVRIAKRF